MPRSFPRILCVLACAAGMSRAESVIQDFRSRKAFDAFWEIATWGDAAHQYAAANVALDTAKGWVRLKLDASPAGVKPVGGEIVSKRADFRYGSYRASIRFDSVPGAVVGWFTYKDAPDLNEIDVEFLTRDPRTVHYTLHHIETNVDSRKKTLAFDPTAAFHEYRFDWHPGKVVYYIDGVKSDSLVKDVPDSACAILLNFWSSNLPGWGGAAPTRDTYMYVNRVEYHSDYGTAGLARSGRRPERRSGRAAEGGIRYRCDGRAVVPPPGARPSRPDPGYN